MLKWEYCILSGVETSLKRRLSVSVAFSGNAQANRNFDVELDRDKGDEIFTSGFLGDRGGEGWELVAFHRAPPTLEAVLKRPMFTSESETELTLESNQADRDSARKIGFVSRNGALED
ncbi:MAG: hypothetical protein FJ145_18440 [Deltaproteobacteria bacterium]|nr:hypothetical protein [Deltaproteobacteria bacterium]